MATYQKKDWTNELGQPTHKLNYTGELVMIFEIDKETGLLHCLTNNEASVWVERKQLTEVK
tara:strand:+ start:166 stop:348 length:183 start_codon:yes stop_codon:yes gene_type:complete